MVKAVVLDGAPQDPDAFERYYADTHISTLATAIPGLQRFEAARSIANAGRERQPLPAHRRAHLRGHGTRSRRGSAPTRNF